MNDGALSEAERADFKAQLRQNLGYTAWVIEDTMTDHVERILSARLAASREAEQAVGRVRAEGGRDALIAAAEAQEWMVGTFSDHTSPGLRRRLDFADWLRDEAAALDPERAGRGEGGA